MLIFGMLIVEFQVLLNLKKIHLFCVQSITEMLLYFGDICNFLKSVSVPPIQKKKKLHYSSSRENNSYPYDMYVCCKMYQHGGELQPLLQLCHVGDIVYSIINMFNVHLLFVNLSVCS